MRYPGAGYDGTDAWGFAAINDGRKVWWKFAGAGSLGNALPIEPELYKLDFFHPTAGGGDWQPIEAAWPGALKDELYHYDPRIPWAGGAKGKNHQFIGSEFLGSKPGEWAATGPGPNAPANTAYNARPEGAYLWLAKDAALYVKWDFGWKIDRAWSALRLTQVTQAVAPPTEPSYHRLRISKVIAQQTVQQCDYAFDAASNTWTLMLQDSGVLVRTESNTIVEDSQRNLRTEVRQVAEAGRPGLYAVETYQLPLGKLIRSEATQNGRTRVTTRTWYDDPADPRFGELRSWTNADGSWGMRDYHVFDDGRVPPAGLAMEVKGGADIPMPDQPRPDAGHVFVYSYAPDIALTSDDPTVNPREPRQIRELAKGIEIATAYNSFSMRDGLKVKVEDRWATQAAKAARLVVPNAGQTVTAFYAGSAGKGDPSLEDHPLERIASVIRPDASQDNYTYEPGTYTPGGSNPGYFTPGPGLDLQTTVQRQPASTGNTSKTMQSAAKQIRVTDAVGQELMKQTFALIAGAEQLTDWTTRIYDAAGNNTAVYGTDRGARTLSPLDAGSGCDGECCGDVCISPACDSNKCQACNPDTGTCQVCGGEEGKCCQEGTCVDGCDPLCYQPGCDSNGQCIPKCDKTKCQTCDENGNCVGCESGKCCQSEQSECVDGCSAADCYEPGCQADGTCKTKCDGNKCQKCDGNGNCVSKCKEGQCCQDGECKDQCDPNCYEPGCGEDGQCVPKCKEEDCKDCDGDGNCVSQCDADTCYECDGNGKCVLRCDPSQCCQAGQCVDNCDTQQCYEPDCQQDGTCKQKCKSEDCKTCDGNGTCTSDCDAGQCCQDGTCVDDCDTDQCYDPNCGEDGKCHSKCHEDQCETCDGSGNCQVCDGDPCKICDNGTCVDKCKSSECKTCDGGTCSSNCDPNHCCQNGDCVGECDPKCYKPGCDTNGQCIPKCDKAQCETCDGTGTCVVCEGNPCKECRDGQCKDKAQPCSASLGDGYGCVEGGNISLPMLITNTGTCKDTFEWKGCNPPSAPS